MIADATLTSREHEIAELLAWGATKKDIVMHLDEGITVRTVETHVKNIYEKTGCRAVNELSAWWFCNRFRIPMTLSPLVRKAVVVVAFVIYSFGFSMGMPEHPRARTQHVRVTARTGRSRRKENNYQFKIAA